MNLQYSWKMLSTKEELSFDKVIGYLLHKENGVVLLDGYSWCGKTTILRTLEEASQRPVCRLSYETVVDKLVHVLRKHENCYEYLHDLNEHGAIIGIEDVDYLCGKESTQEYLSEMIRFAAEKHLVILTGNNVQQQTPILFQQCNPCTFVAEKENVEEPIMRDKYCFSGSRAQDSAHYYDIVMSHKYTGDMDYLAWDAAHKFGSRMTAPGLASFRNGITIGENALAAAEFLDAEYQTAYASCEEYGRRKRMQELMADVYERARAKFAISIKLL